jgi:Flp pilus assembly pilin Flp
VNANVLRELLLELHRDEDGGAAVEYALIAAGLAVPAMIGVALVVTAISGVLSTTMAGFFGYMTQ